MTRQEEEATRGNNKILRTLPPHISSSEEILPRPFPNSEQTNPPSSNHTYPLQHPHTRHTLSLQLHPQTHHIVTPGSVDRPRWIDEVAGQMERYAGWWIKSGVIGLPPQTRVKGVGRHNTTTMLVMFIIMFISGLIIVNYCKCILLFSLLKS